ncbi:MAG: hypothetical protein MJZ20_10465 [Bacteroidaceae bacterium]|nr:hypothetical protein [Bacteroidaceae bacterium]
MKYEIRAIEYVQRMMMRKAAAWCVGVENFEYAHVFWKYHPAKKAIYHNTLFMMTSIGNKAFSDCISL